MRNRITDDLHIAMIAYRIGALVDHLITVEVFKPYIPRLVVAAIGRLDKTLESRGLAYSGVGPVAIIDITIHLSQLLTGIVVGKDPRLIVILGDLGRIVRHPGPHMIMECLTSYLAAVMPGYRKLYASRPHVRIIALRSEERRVGKECRSRL